MMAVIPPLGISISKRQAGPDSDENHTCAARSAIDRLQNVMGCFRMKRDARDRASLSIRIVGCLRHAQPPHVRQPRRECQYSSRCQTQNAIRDGPGAAVRTCAPDFEGP